MQDSQNFVTRLYEQVKEFSTLSLENFRLLLAEKLTMLLSMIALAVIVFGLMLVMFFFLSVCIANLLADVMPLAWAYAIMAVVDLVLTACVILFRKQLLMDPVARFITRIILS